MRIKSSTRFLLYMVYGLVLTFSLLYIRFPSSEFEIYCERQLEKKLGFTACDIESIKFGFPLAIVFHQIKMQNKSGDDQAMLVIDKLSVRPAVKFWRTFSISGSAYSGDISSRLKVNWSEKSYTLTDTTLSNLSLSELLKDQAITNRNVLGKLDGSGTFEASWAPESNTSAKARFAVSKGSFELLQPVLSLPAIDFDKINFDIVLGDEIEIQEGKLRGKDINANFDGSLTMVGNLSESRLRLSGFLEPRREFLQSHPVEAKMVQQYAKRFRKNALPFKMGGTITSPTFRFSR